MRHEDEPAVEKPFWDLDEELGELELQERPGGPDLYTVRLKAQTATAPYSARRELYPLEQDGIEHEVSGKAYILVPDFSLTVDLYPEVQHSGAIGEITESLWNGMRHHDIGKARGLYFVEDRSIALWEVDSFGRLNEFTHGQLWQAFERWLIAHFAQAERIFTDDDEPGDSRTENQEFLRSLGYEPAAGTQRIFAREVRDL